MRVLLDESVPNDLRRYLGDHRVSTVQDEGWKGAKDGELLERASQEFDVFVTADQNLPHQQNLGRFELAVVILVAYRNRLEDYLPLLPELREAVLKSAPGEAVEVCSVADSK